MGVTLHTVRLAFAFAGVVLAGAAVAKDDCAGHQISVGARNVSVNHEIENGNVRQIVAGACDADGRCVLKDKEGDDQIIDNAYVPGDETPTWRVVGGSGKYAHLAASGWYRQAYVDGDVRVFTWGGDCRATTKRVREVRLTRADLESVFSNAAVAGMCTDGTLIENRFGAGGKHEHITRNVGGQLLFRDDNARWSPQDVAGGALLCFQWSSGGTSCWQHSRLEDRYIAREHGGQGRTCWFSVVPQ